MICLLWLSSGCATTQERFGDHARFSPAFRGYVLASHSGSDDPDLGQAVLILRDPLTGDKLRCREQVLAWREVMEDLATDQVADDNAAITAAATTGAVFAPLLALQPVGGLVTVEAMLFGSSLYSALSSEDPFDLLQAGMTLFNRTRYAQAARLLERALAKNAAVGIVDRAYYYLGLCYAKLDKPERARLALWQFIYRAGVRDVNAYRKAEATLRELGGEVDTCTSLKPVRVYW